MSTTTGAGLEGVIAGESEICYIDGYAGVLSYRGYNVHTLADHSTFEEVVFLLWNGRLPKRSELDALKAELVANEISSSTFRQAVALAYAQGGPGARSRGSPSPPALRARWWGLYARVKSALSYGRAPG